MEDAQSSYIYRIQSSVWRLSKLLTPIPSPPSECVPPHQRTRRAVRGQYFGRRQTLDWPLTIKSLYGKTYPYATVPVMLSMHGATVVTVIKFHSAYTDQRWAVRK
jgi:hypothetical protein